jgi:aryl-alcohol dehydrogenase-like predicted oxidoreductase
VDDAESIRAIHCALDLGINFFDTAANYGCGHSERILGQAVAGRREEVILATKFGYIIDEENRVVTRTEDVVGRIRQECEDSLRRLKTDYIDLYQFHKEDYDLVKAAEVRDILETLVEEGKIRWYGWSTNNPEGARVFAQGDHCTAIQHTLSMKIVRPGLLEVLKICEEHDLASINRYPLGSGFLTGKYTQSSTFQKDDYRQGWNLQEEWAEEWFRQIEALRQAFAGDARTLAHVALGWIWARSDCTIPIPGFKNASQVQENIKAMEFGALNKEQMKKIEAIFGRA